MQIRLQHFLKGSRKEGKYICCWISLKRGSGHKVILQNVRAGRNMQFGSSLRHTQSSPEEGGGGALGRVRSSGGGEDQLFKAIHIINYQSSQNEKPGLLMTGLVHYSRLIFVILLHANSQCINHTGNPVRQMCFESKVNILGNIGQPMNQLSSACFSACMFHFLVFSIFVCM